MLQKTLRDTTRNPNLMVRQTPSGDYSIDTHYPATQPGRQMAHLHYNAAVRSIEACLGSLSLRTHNFPLTLTGAQGTALASAITTHHGRSR